MADLWKSIVAKLTGAEAVPAATLQELRAQRELSAAKDEADKIARKDYGHAMTPWGLLSVFDPSDPRFRDQVNRVFETESKGNKELWPDGTVKSKGLAKWQISATMAKHWTTEAKKRGEFKQVKRDRPGAIKQFEQAKEQKGFRPERTQKQSVGLQKGIPAEVIIPDLYGKTRI